MRFFSSSRPLHSDPLFCRLLVFLVSAESVILNENKATKKKSHKTKTGNLSNSGGWLQDSMVSLDSNVFCSLMPSLSVCLSVVGQLLSGMTLLFSKQQWVVIQVFSLTSFLYPGLPAVWPYGTLNKRMKHCMSSTWEDKKKIKSIWGLPLTC